MVATTRAAHARNLLGPLIRSTYRITAYDESNMPRHGAVLVLCPWNNIAAPTVLKAGLPRPVHVWASGPASLPGPLLSVTGDLAVPDGQPGIASLREAVRLLKAGEAVAVVDVVDVGYAIAATGAPIQCITVDAPATKRPTDPPSRKSAITLTIGPVRYVPEHLRNVMPTQNTARAAGEWARQVLADSANVRFEIDS